MDRGFESRRNYTSFSVSRRMNHFPPKIVHFVLLTTGLYGANNRQALDIDIVCELCDELIAPLIGRYFERDEEKKVISK